MHSPELILIADDEPDTATLLTRVCERFGYQVTIAHDGVAALEKISALKPDLVLLDIQMPHMDGFAVLESLRKSPETQKLPVIIVTAAATRPQDATHGIEIGADDYIKKPFNYNELMARIHAKLNARRLEEQLIRRTHALEKLVEIGTILNESMRIEPLAKSLLKFISDMLDISTAALHIYPYEGKGVFSLMLHKGTYQDNVTLDTHHDENNSLLTAAQIQTLLNIDSLESGIICTMHNNQIRIGQLLVANDHDRLLTDDDLQVMSSIAHQASLALRNIQHYQSVQNHAEELEERVEERTAALVNMQHQLIRSEKLASLGRLSAEIAHEINNPLQPIMMNLENTIDDLQSGYAVDVEGLEIALNEATRMKGIVNRLLDYARPNNSGFQPIDLGQIIQDIVRLTAKKANHANIQMQLHLDTYQTIMGNKDQITQVILNLVINAMDAIQENGEIRIQLTQVDKTIDLNIHDNGEGIPQEIIDNIFEPFFSSKEEGSGLGLAITHSIIDGHGGTISVESQPGAGTTFLLRFPLS